ncbi:hypothetical protein HAX54_022366 [Datura stramonium]|uniref:Uncharacterized protein n=1 Tax=Datura stramonium TaxID=4076 RepID=A0ABS8UW86_DATST|nr:hypothetical protein [Datura stramonium]
MRGRKERRLICRNFSDSGGLPEIMEAVAWVWWLEIKRNGRGMVSGRGLVHRSSGSFPAGLGIVVRRRHGVNERRRGGEKREAVPCRRTISGEGNKRKGGRSGGDGVSGGD